MIAVLCEACLGKVELYTTVDGPRFFDREPIHARTEEERSKGTHLLVGRAMIEIVPFSGAGDLLEGTISEEQAQAKGGGLRYSLHENTCKVTPSKPPEMTKTRDVRPRRHREEPPDV